MSCECLSCLERLHALVMVGNESSVSYLYLQVGGVLSVSGSEIHKICPEAMNKGTNLLSSALLHSYNNNYHGSPGEGFGIATITKCSMTVSVDLFVHLANVHLVGQYWPTVWQHCCRKHAAGCAANAFAPVVARCRSRCTPTLTTWRRASLCTPSSFPATAPWASEQLASTSHIDVDMISFDCT